MKRALTICGSLLALMLVSGCEKKQETPAPAANDTPAVQTPTPAPATPDKALAATATVDLEKVAVEEQFEKEVETEVTPANFEQQLDALEKEVKAE
jgi:hypothetical protein